MDSIHPASGPDDKLAPAQSEGEVILTLRISPATLRDWCDNIPEGVTDEQLAGYLRMAVRVHEDSLYAAYDSIMSDAAQSVPS